MLSMPDYAKEREFIFKKDWRDKILEKHRKRKAREQLPTKIVLERVYLGGQSLEDAFRKINEETVRKNIEEIVGKTV